MVCKPIVSRPTFHRRAAVRAFTLVELMVAMAAGLIVAVGAFAFSKESARIFAQEARIASSQIGVLAGLQRLQNDISRAAFMASPNINRDVGMGKVCGYATWPPGLQKLNLAGVLVVPGKTFPDGRVSDVIRIFGNLASTELLTVRYVSNEAAGHTIYLTVNDGPISRLGIRDDATLAELFKVGRMVRIADKDGHYQYSMIQAASWNNGQPNLVVDPTFPLLFKGVGGSLCGVVDGDPGNMMNVVNVVDYGLANLNDPNWQAYKDTIYSAASSLPSDASRTELVRAECLGACLTNPNAVGDFAADPTKNNLELVAEYAVDLRFGLWVTNPGVAGVQFIAPSTAGIKGRVVDNILLPSASGPGTAANGPESVRTVQIRLAIRARDVDANLDLGDGGLPAAGDGLFYRIGVPGVTGAARVRNLVADVMLRNQRGEAW